jgi:hypothetical protein
MGVKDAFFERGSMEVGNGRNNRFWEDTWLGNMPLCDQYPSLYRIVNHINVTVAQVMHATPLNIGFRRALSDNTWDRWVRLVVPLMRFHLSENDDVFHRNLTSSAQFLVKYMYLDLLNSHTGYFKKYI